MPVDSGSTVMPLCLPTAPNPISDKVLHKLGQHMVLMLQQSDVLMVQFKVSLSTRNEFETTFVVLIDCLCKPIDTLAKHLLLVNKLMKPRIGGPAKSECENTPL